MSSSGAIEEARRHAAHEIVEPRLERRAPGGKSASVVIRTRTARSISHHHRRRIRLQRVVAPSPRVIMI